MARSINAFKLTFCAFAVSAANACKSGDIRVINLPEYCLYGSTQSALHASKNTFSEISPSFFKPATSAA